MVYITDLFAIIDSMTTTFYATSANHTPTYSERACTCLPDSDCYFCKGDGYVSICDAPELCVSNSTAFHLLDLIGITPDYSGKISPDLIADLRRNILKLTNVPSLLDPEDDKALSFLFRVDSILAYCQEYGECFAWG